jgi:hypothetical protein
MTRICCNVPNAVAACFCCSFASVPDDFLDIDDNGVDGGLSSLISNVSNYYYYYYYY